MKDVGSIQLQGDRRREIQLLLNADRLNAYGLTVDQVRTAITRQNVEVPGGNFMTGPSEVALRTLGRIRNVDDFNRIVLAYRDGSVITFGDIGRVQDGIQEIRQANKINGGASRRPAGPKAVRHQYRRRRRPRPGQARTDPDDPAAGSQDQHRERPVALHPQFLRGASRCHLLLGGLLASVVVFFFIRNLRVTLIAALAVPTSIIGTFTVMKIVGFTLNNMTMLALSLATGIVIDDAIVVLENIFRFVEEKGITPKEAAAEATAEIGLAVMATTLSLVVIFVPVAFMTGQIGRYFYSFGITSAAAILISMFVSFTLTPALCAMWLNEGRRQIRSLHAKSGGVYAKMDADYGRMLVWALRHRAVMMGIAAVVVASAAFLYPLRRQGTGARRRSERIHRQHASAQGNELDAHR